MTDRESGSAVEARVDPYGTNEKLAEEFPEHLRTRYTELELRCPRCTSMWNAIVTVVANAKTHPAATEGVLRKTLHHSRCPACKQHSYDVDQIWEYYDPDRELIVQVRPKWEYKAAGGEDGYFKRLESLVLKHQEDNVRVDVVYGVDELVEKYLGGEEAHQAAMRRREKERELKMQPGMIRAENEHEFMGDDKPAEDLA
ncbi:MAG: CpXC domain-containing protein [Chloroflexota bacterium]